MKKAQPELAVAAPVFSSLLPFQFTGPQFESVRLPLQVEGTEHIAVRTFGPSPLLHQLHTWQLQSPDRVS